MTKKVSGVAAATVAVRFTRSSSAISPKKSPAPSVAMVRPPRVTVASPEMITKNVEVKKGDILIINTGYHRYAWDQKQSDELRYFVKHPGPGPGFHQWALDMKLKWIGVDCGSADHPMNTIIRNWHPARFAEAEKKLKAKYGKTWDEMFPPDEYYQVMHLKLFPLKLVHAENVGGEIEKVSNQRAWIGAYPLRGIEMESAMCRIVATLPPK